VPAHRRSSASNDVGRDVEGLHRPSSATQPQVDEARGVGGQHLALDQRAAQRRGVVFEERALEGLPPLQREGRLAKGRREPELPRHLQHRHAAQRGPHIRIAPWVRCIQLQAPPHVSAHCPPPPDTRKR
jgi:hypothetical protein